MRRSFAALLTAGALLVTSGCGSGTSPADDVPALATALDAVDEAVVSDDDKAVRDAVAELTDTTTRARKAGDLEAAEADRILAAAEALLAALGEPAPAPRGDPRARANPRAGDGRRGRGRGRRRGRRGVRARAARPARPLGQEAQGTEEAEAREEALTTPPTSTAADRARPVPCGLSLLGNRTSTNGPQIPHTRRVEVRRRTVRPTVEASPRTGQGLPRGGRDGNDAALPGRRPEVRVVPPGSQASLVVVQEGVGRAHRHGQPRHRHRDVPRAGRPRASRRSAGCTTTRAASRRHSRTPSTRSWPAPSGGP